MKRIALSLCLLFLAPMVCSCNNSNSIEYKNNTLTESDLTNESVTYKVSYRYLYNPVTTYNEAGEIISYGNFSGIRYWAGQDYDFGVFSTFVENEFYCLGDSIVIHYDKTKTNDSAFQYDIKSVERIHTATVETVSLNVIERNEQGGIESINGKSTTLENTHDNTTDCIVITSKSMEWNYLSKYTEDVLYKAIDSKDGYVYYSFDPRT